MALYRISTEFFEVVNVDDDCVEAAGDGAANRWVARSSAQVSDGATVVRIRALTRPEIDAAPMKDDALFLASMVETGVHEADKALVASLPWQYQRTLGGLIFEVSSRPLDRANGP